MWGVVKLDFDLNEPTVIIGNNGAGKSSVLDCLAILLSWFNNSIQYTEKDGDEFRDSDINNQCEETQNQITIFTNDLEVVSWKLKKLSLIHI